MKKSLFVVLTMVAIVALMAGTAFAVRYDSGYLDPTAGQSPHGGYLTTTNKCAVCHAVHNPGGVDGLSQDDKAIDGTRDANLGGSEVLLREDVANACTYCHVSNNFDIKTVYSEDPTLYNGADPNGHTSDGNPISHDGVNCVDCHQVHGANQMMVAAENGGLADDLYMQKKILKYNDGDRDDDAPDMVANGVGGANGANMSTWCTQCHRYYNDAYNGDSHVMKADYSNYTNGSATNVNIQVAFDDSEFCRSCHQAGTTNQAVVVGGTGGVDNYPHYTTGYRFLNSGANVQSGGPSGGVGDGNCLICHASDNAGVVEGVGLSF